MRSFFFLLLVTNLAFVGWHMSQERGEAEKQTTKLAHNGLTLLTELSAEKRPPLREGVQVLSPIERSDGESGKESTADYDAASEGAVTTPSSVTKQCMRISGINEEVLAENLRRRLREAGVTVLHHGSKQAQRTNYWVILPPYPNSKGAAEAAAILKKKGIKDFYIISSGENKNSLSLGVFSTRKHAETRQNRIVALKVPLPSPTITTKKVPAKDFWLEYEVSGTAQQDSIEAILRDIGAGMSKEIACE